MLSAVKTNLRRTLTYHSFDCTLKKVRNRHNVKRSFFSLMLLMFIVSYKHGSTTVCSIFTFVRQAANVHCFGHQLCEEIVNSLEQIEFSIRSVECYKN